MPSLPPTTSFHARGPRPLRRAFRLCAAASFAMAIALTTTPAQAASLPATSAKNKLDKLNRKADKLVNQYDKAKENLDAAKKRLKSIKSQAATEQRRYNQLHTQVAQIVADEYKRGTADANTAVLAGSDPAAALDRISTFVALTNNRGQALKAFLDSTQRLQRELAEVQSSVQDVKKKAADLKKKKAAAQKAVDKQKALMGPSRSSSSGSIGGTYNGPASGSARKALEYAYAQKGKPYHYGGTGPDSFDCSGLVMMAWRAGGVSLPRVVPDQYNATRRVARSDLQPGDLVFFDGLGHVGLYVGNDSFIHAPRTGETVRIDSLSGYWSSHYYGAGRP